MCISVVNSIHCLVPNITYCVQGLSVQGLSVQGLSVQGLSVQGLSVYQFVSYLHVARDTAYAEFKVRATFAVILLSLALFKSMIFNIKLFSCILAMRIQL
jgi:hypothetical protein